MKSGMKKFLWYGFLIFVVFRIIKFVKKMIALKNISGTLPQYLENLIDEKPTMNINLSFNKAFFKIKLSQETIDKNPELENTIREYITDFYPAFPMDKTTIEIEAKAEKKEEVKPEPKKEPAKKKAKKEPDSKPEA